MPPFFCTTHSLRKTFLLSLAKHPLIPGEILPFCEGFRNFSPSELLPLLDVHPYLFKVYRLTVTLNTLPCHFFLHIPFLAINFLRIFVVFYLSWCLAQWLTYNKCLINVCGIQFFFAPIAGTFHNSRLPPDFQREGREIGTLTKYTQPVPTDLVPQIEEPK